MLAMDSAEGGDKYRSFLHGDGEKNTVWRHGAPPNYDLVNKLFEEERTKVRTPSVRKYLSSKWIKRDVYKTKIRLDT